MIFQNAHLIFNLIQIYIFIKLSISNINNLRILNEANQTEETEVTQIAINSTNQVYESNITIKNETNKTNKLSEEQINEMRIICSTFTDCFNCTVVQYCRWYNNSCVLYRQYYRNYSIPILYNKYEYNDIDILDDYVNFIRKSCFLYYTPFLENDNSPIYNNISIKYCGKHYITNHLDNYSKEFKIELNNINGIYGVPNILCEYVILSGPNSFDVNVDINENDKKNFYLLYSDNSLYFYKHFNESTVFRISSTSRRANTFVYYGLKSLNSSPFKITFKESKEEKSSQTTGYILIAIIALIFIIIVSSIIYIRCNSKLFKKDKTHIQEEEEKIKDKTEFNINTINNNTDIKNNDNNTLQLTNNSNIINSTDPITPDALKENEIQKQFFFENLGNNEINNINGIYLCCFDNQIINNVNEIYKARCGHLYHLQCINKLIQNNIALTGKLEFRCLSCQTIIYP